MATEKRFIIGRFKHQFIQLHRHTKQLSRLRLSIAPSHQAEGAVGKSELRRAQRMAHRAPHATAARHVVPFSNLVIRTLTKTHLSSGGSK